MSFQMLLFEIGNLLAAECVKSVLNRENIIRPFPCDVFPYLTLNFIFIKLANNVTWYS